MKTEQTDTHEFKANETKKLIGLIDAIIDNPELVRIYITRWEWKNGEFEVEIKTRSQNEQIKSN